MARFLAVGVALAALAASPVRAEVKRYALVVGTNRGHADETPLRYAESDAVAMAAVLAELGQVQPRRIVRLVGERVTAQEVLSALVDLNLVIQNDLRDSGGEAVLFVYYSGHGDAASLHVGPTDLDAVFFSKTIRTSPAKLKVLLLDACRSGGLTRVKGGRPVAPFQIEAEDRLRNEGYAIVTSSAAGEDAQESDRLQSSLFTHYFLSGLRGAGDTNGDLRVTLGEAYAYARDQTLKASIKTVAGFQHATFEYELRGRADPVLTDLRNRGELGQLTLLTVGDYLVMRDDDSDTVIVEANTRTSGISVLVPAARYRVLLRTRRSVYRTTVALAPRQVLQVELDQMQSLPVAQIVRKGVTHMAQGPSLAGLVQSPMDTGFGPMAGVRLSYSLELMRLTLAPRLEITGGGTNDLPYQVQSHNLRQLGIELAVLHAFDFGNFTVAPMISGGVGLLDQQVREQCPDQHCAIFTPRSTLGLFSAGVLLAYPLSQSFTLEASVELTEVLGRWLKSTVADDADATLGVRQTFRAALGIGYRF